MRPGVHIGEILRTERGQRFRWTGYAWLWEPERREEQAA